MEVCLEEVPQSHPWILNAGNQLTRKIKDLKNCDETIEEERKKAE